MLVPSVEGYWISEDFARLSELLQIYDPYLELRWIPTDKRETPFERANPYVIFDTRSNYIVKYISEQDIPEQVLADIFLGDHSKHDPQKRLNALAQARHVLETKKRHEEMEEAKDLAAFFLATEKNYINHNGRKFDDQMRDYNKR